MKPRKLPSGSWNVRVMIGGQTYSFTHADKKTVIRMASDFADAQREKVRNVRANILNYKELVDSYVKVSDWRVKENSTVTYSVGGLILSNSGAITANY